MVTAVDTSVLLDVLLNDPRHAGPSITALRQAANQGSLVICEVNLAEIVPTLPPGDASSVSCRLEPHLCSLVDVSVWHSSTSPWGSVGLAVVPDRSGSYLPASAMGSARFRWEQDSIVDVTGLQPLRVFPRAGESMSADPDGPAQKHGFNEPIAREVGLLTWRCGFLTNPPEGQIFSLRPWMPRSRNRGPSQGIPLNHQIRSASFSKSRGSSSAKLQKAGHYPHMLRHLNLSLWIQRILIVNSTPTDKGQLVMLAAPVEPARLKEADRPITGHDRCPVNLRSFQPSEELRFGARFRTANCLMSPYPGKSRYDGLLKSPWAAAHLKKGSADLILKPTLLSVTSGPV